MKYLLPLMLVLCVGCDLSSTNTEKLGAAFFGDNVKEVKLSDGTNCAVFQGVHGGGITCDWNKGGGK